MACRFEGETHHPHTTTATAAPASPPAGSNVTTVLIDSLRAICVHPDPGRRIFPTCLLPCVALARRPCWTRNLLQGEWMDGNRRRVIIDTGGHQCATRREPGFDDSAPQGIR
jgi:hypothetical protein